MFEHTLKEPFERHYEDQVASPGLLHMFHSLRLCVHTNLMSWNGVKKERKRKGQSGEKDRNSDVLTYLNVRNYGYAHMKAKAAPFQSRFLIHVMTIILEAGEHGKARGKKGQERGNRI